MNNLFKICDVAVCNESITTIINSEIAIALGILGISITIFTVIYSFIENRLEDKKKIERQLHIADVQDPYKRAELKFVNSYIKRNKFLNKFFVWLIWFSFIYIFVLVVNFFWSNLIFFIFSQVLSLIYFLSFIICILYYVYRYRKKIS